MTDERFYVYIHRRGDNNEVFYVGKGSFRRAWCKSDRSRWWKNVVAKHGFTWEIVEQGMFESEAHDLEVELIKFYRECGHPLVNCTDGGGGISGHRHTDEAKAKISAAQKGRKWSDEQRRQKSESMMGIRQSDEIRAKRSASMKGKQHSEAAKKKMGFQSQKAVVCSNGMVFPSIRQAKQWINDTGLSSSPASNIRAICQCLKGKTKSAFGFGWRYLCDWENARTQ